MIGRRGVGDTCGCVGDGTGVAVGSSLAVGQGVGSGLDSVAFAALLVGVTTAAVLV